MLVVIVGVKFYDNSPIKFHAVAKDNFILSIEVDDVWSDGLVWLYITRIKVDRKWFVASLQPKHSFI